MKHKVESFRSSDGIQLSFRSGGNPSGPPIVFCYGLVCSAFHFKYQWEYFSKNYRLLMLDYRGHGEAEESILATTVTFPRIADDLAAFLDHLKISKPVSVLGHSMGVNVALEFFERYPNKVHSLSLIAGAATFPAEKNRELRGLNFARSVMQIMDGLFPRLVEEFWKLQSKLPAAERVARRVGFNPRLAKPEDIRQCIKVMSGFSPRIFFQLLGEYLQHDRRDTLARVKVPTLVVSGENDRMVPPVFQKRLHEEIFGSQLLSVPAGSHCPQFDRPDMVNTAVDAFLKRSFRKQGRNQNSRGRRKVIATSLRA